MTLTIAMQSFYKDSTAGEQPLNQCENLDEILNEIASELTQTKWIGITNYLRIDPDKLHLVKSANQEDLQRQKTLGLLCWIEDETKNATFEKLINALVQVDAKGLAGDLRNFCRLFRMRKNRPARKVDSLQTQYYSMQFTQYPQIPKSSLGHSQWKFSEIPQSHFLYASPTVAFYPSKSVPSHSDFDLTSTVSIQGAKVNLLQRDAWTAKPIKQVPHRPATLSTYSTSSRKRALGNHRKSGQLEISTFIKTAVPLSKALYQDCHPEEMQEKIAGKLFDYLLNPNGSKEALLMIATLETIDGLVIKRIRRGSLKVETNLHKMSALKALIKHFETGQLNDMFQEILISDTALKMAGAFAISLETNIDRRDLEVSFKELQENPRTAAASNNRSYNRRNFVHSHRSLSPPRAWNSFKNGHLPSSLGFSNRLSTVPNSRSVTVDLSPSVRTVKPEPRGFFWKSEKSKGGAKSDFQSGVVFSAVDEQHAQPLDGAAETNLANEASEKEKTNEAQPAPPPTPDFFTGKDEIDTSKNEEAIKVALDDLDKRTNEAEDSYRYFDDTMLRRLVDLLKQSPEYGIELINHVADLRKYATILRQNDDADTAQLVEKYVKVTESLDQIHRDVTSKIWLRIADNGSASAKSRDSSGSPRRSPLRNRVTQSIEIWRQMQEPEYNFTELETEDRLKSIFTPDELSKYGGLLSHVPALLASAKTCHQLLNHYMHAP